MLAAFALCLPHTPPKGYGRPVREVLGLPALKMFRDRSFVVFAGVLFVGNMMNQFYTLFTAPYLHDLGVHSTSGRWDAGAGSGDDAGAVVRDRVHGRDAAVAPRGSG